MATRQANKDVVRRFYEGWNRGAIDFEAFVADEIVNYQPEAEPERGRDRFAAAIRGVMNAVPERVHPAEELFDVFSFPPSLSKPGAGDESISPGTDLRGDMPTGKLADRCP